MFNIILLVFNIILLMLNTDFLFSHKNFSLCINKKFSCLDILKIKENKLLIVE